ncbi:MAG: peroxide stress protein YaaA [Candidatus Omnitrophica bacterium]|nr:peroxide stress protein YaaA [Candidatus Omnitrophota bacterium]
MKVLYLIPCSNHKERKGGVPEYSKEKSILNFLTNTRDLLKNTRREIFKLIKEYDKLSEKPSNKFLKEGPDLGGKEEGCCFMPAIKRYKGKLYTQISEENWSNRKNEVLILSGLYGFVYPEELIQLYNLDLEFHPEITKKWEDTLTLVLKSFAKRRK